MKYNGIILTLLFNIFFFICFFNPVKADDRVCGNDLTNFFYDFHDEKDDEFEYPEKRNDSGVQAAFKDLARVCSESIR